VSTPRKTSLSLPNAVADLFLPKGPASTAIALTADQVARRAGLFVDVRMELPMRLSAQDKTLQLPGGAALVAVSPHEFRVGSFGIASLHFEGDDRFVLEGGDGDPIKYRREHPWQPAQSQLASFAGRYSSDEAQARYRVTLEGDGSFRSGSKSQTGVRRYV
jgi:hypothetical protein